MDSHLNLLNFREEIESRDGKIGSDTTFHLIFGITREYSENHRNIIGNIEVHDTTRSFTTDVVEVWSIPTDDDTDRDDEIVFIRLDQAFCESRKLEGSWNRECIDIRESFSFQKIPILAFNIARIFLIEFGYHEGDMDITIEYIDVSEACFIVGHRVYG